MTLDSDRATLRPWDPLPGEPGTSYAGFVTYREQRIGHRSLRRVAQRLGRARSLIERYSSRFGWVQRAQAWDVEQAQQRAADRATLEQEWVERHSDVGRRMQAVGVAGLARVLEMDQELVAAGKKVRLGDYLRMITAGSALEMNALTHSDATLDTDFVRQVIDVTAAVFQEANRYDSPEERTAAFAAGCARALEQIVSVGAGTP